MPNFVISVGVKLLPIIAPIIIKYGKDRWDDYRRKQNAIIALKKAVNEKDSSYVESIVNSL